MILGIDHFEPESVLSPPADEPKKDPEHRVVLLLSDTVVGTKTQLADLLDVGCGVLVLNVGQVPIKELRDDVGRIYL